MPVKDNRFKTLCDNANEVHNHIKERIAKKERKRKLKKKTGQIPCKSYLQELMTKLTDVSSYLGQIYQDPFDEFSTEDYLTFSSGLRDSLQFTFAQVDKLLEGSSKNFDSSELSAFITKLHHITEEMKLLFPQGTLNQNVICVKPEVEKWWQENFPRRVIVPKDDFYKAFYDKHRRFQNDNEGVRETMAFTSELFVSKYQLDLFTR
ncbi:unnamed protein product [Dibothriocephalus latus]|uniref:Cbl-PTB domain-containing protein n=1 Tax=Dibothriocephalus latus TaxID=60516 RepID=A0A3P7LG83_DIBLA|nr:unnamed protein product [Dibothriocephalus latus]